MENQLVILGSDHRGLKLKNQLVKHLQSKNVPWIDLGPHTLVPTDDYPDYAFKVSKYVASKNALGILICWDGIGMSIAANKVRGIRAAVVHDITTARYARRDDGANILCLPGYMRPILASKLVDIFLKEKFAGGRHLRRINKIRKLEG
jgi:ribose 5-phosphate isomerase B